MKPKIFISSTIYDFKDLRSSIKYYLNGLGYEVIASEFNDFNGPINQDSFSACLKAIEQCQYFILLIGTRVGGFYTLENKISITRQEYRVAYELAQLGHLKIITFIRQDVFTAISNITELERILVECSAIELEKIPDIVKTKHVNDAHAIKDFIDEIRRVDDFKLQKSGARPINNWYFSFNGFGDIVDTFKSQLNIYDSIEAKFIRQRAEEESYELLDKLLHKTENSVGSYLDMFTEFQKEYKATIEKSIQMDRSDLTKYFMASTFISMYVKSVKIDFLRKLISDARFHILDQSDGKFVQPIAIKFIEKTVHAIDYLVSMANSFDQSETLKKFEKDMRIANGEILVHGSDVYAMIIITGQYGIVLEALRHVIGYLSGKTDLRTTVFTGTETIIDLSSPMFHKPGMVLASARNFVEILYP